MQTWSRRSWRTAACLIAAGVTGYMLYRTHLLQLRSGLQVDPYDDDDEYGASSW